MISVSELFTIPKLFGETDWGASSSTSNKVS
jgi:hypothetical protein